MEAPPSQKEKRFDKFFRDPVYLLYKNHLYNYLVRRWFIRSIFRRKIGRRVLELGCGISPMLGETKQTIRTDLAWHALAFLRDHSRNGAVSPYVACSAIQLPFKNSSLEGVICSEVVEHVEKDDEVLKEIARVLAKNGVLVLTCPNHPQLFGFDDQFVGHLRRYELNPLIQKLSLEGFEKFRIRAVLGPLEKLVMENIAKFLALLQMKKTAPSKPGFPIHLLAKLFFPFYLLLSYSLAACVYLQAKFLHPEKGVSVGIQCYKR